MKNIKILLGMLIIPFFGFGQIAESFEMCIVTGVLGGSGDYSLEWSDGQMDECFTPTQAGEYCLTVTDNGTGKTLTVCAECVEIPDCPGIFACDKPSNPGEFCAVDESGNEIPCPNGICLCEPDCFDCESNLTWEYDAENQQLSLFDITIGSNVMANGSPVFVNQGETTVVVPSAPVEGKYDIIISQDGCESCDYCVIPEELCCPAVACDTINIVSTDVSEEFLLSSLTEGCGLGTILKVCPSINEEDKSSERIAFNEKLREDISKDAQDGCQIFTIDEALDGCCIPVELVPNNGCQVSAPIVTVTFNDNCIGDWSVSNCNAPPCTYVIPNIAYGTFDESEISGTFNVCEIENNDGLDTSDAYDSCFNFAETLSYEWENECCDVEPCCPTATNTDSIHIIGNYENAEILNQVIEQGGGIGSAISVCPEQCQLEEGVIGNTIQYFPDNGIFTVCVAVGNELLAANIVGCENTVQQSENNDCGEGFNTYIIGTINCEPVSLFLEFTDGECAVEGEFNFTEVEGDAVISCLFGGLKSCPTDTDAQIQAYGTGGEFSCTEEITLIYQDGNHVLQSNEYSIQNGFGGVSIEVTTANPNNCSSDSDVTQLPNNLGNLVSVICGDGSGNRIAKNSSLSRPVTGDCTCYMVGEGEDGCCVLNPTECDIELNEEIIYEITPTKIALDIGDISPDGGGGIKNGQSITYELCNENTGNQPIINSTIDDTPPSCFVEFANNPELPNTQAVLEVGEKHCVQLTYIPTGCETDINHTNVVVSSSDNTGTEEVELTLPSAPCTECQVPNALDNNISLPGKETLAPINIIVDNGGFLGASKYVGRTADRTWKIYTSSCNCEKTLIGESVITPGNAAEQVTYLSKLVASSANSFYGTNMAFGQYNNPDVHAGHCYFFTSCDDDCPMTIYYESSKGDMAQVASIKGDEEKTCEAIDFSLSDKCSSGDCCAEIKYTIGRNQSEFEAPNVPQGYCSESINITCSDGSPTTVIIEEIEYNAIPQFLQGEKTILIKSECGNEREVSFTFPEC